MNLESKPERIQFPEIANELARMVDADQAMRERSDKEPHFWDEKIDKQHTERMKEIIAEIGFPTASKVGKEGAKHAWLLVQHADHDVAFQKECLELMNQASAGEVELRDIAYLTDRVRLNEGQKQLYGTQFTQEGGKHIPRPIEDEEHVDARRAEMGMDSLEDNIALMYRKYPQP